MMNLGGSFKYFLFSPAFGEDEPILTHVFQRGWFNHQLDEIIETLLSFLGPDIFFFWAFLLCVAWNLELLESLVQPQNEARVVEQRLAGEPGLGEGV